MRELTADEIASELAPFLDRAGLVPYAIEVKPGEMPLPEFPNVDVTIDMADHTPEEVVLKAKAMTRAIDQAIGGSCRIGYYDAEIGYDDVPAGKCLIQIDLLPFVLSQSPSPAR